MKALPPPVRAAIVPEQETAVRLAREAETEVEAMILGTKKVEVNGTK